MAVAPIPPRANEITAAIIPGSNAPITPLKVKTVTVKLVPPKNVTPNAVTAALATKPEPVRTAALAPQSPEEALVETLAAAAPIETTPPATQPGILGTLPAMIAATAVPSAKAEPAPPAKASPPPKAEEHFASAPRHAVRGGWAIQVGAYEDEGEAKQHLSAAKSKISRVLEKAEPYIERTVKGVKTYYRARFAGFDRDQAEAVCKRLKREDVACMALKI
jgi:D-alanyl-D-alanine carboxypeptidase